jgi:DNA polymerase-3 subunit beta
MRTEVAIEKLKDGVALANRFVGRGATLEALQGILLIAEGKTLTLRATNLECGVEVSIPARVEEGGVIAVQAGPFSSLVSNLAGSKSATLSITGTTLSLVTDRSNSTIKTVSHEDFPTLPTVSGEHSLSIDAKEFSKTLRSVAFCASLSSIKPELQSVCVYVEGGKLCAAATDSFRLAEKTQQLKGAEVPQLLVPVRNAAELIRILERADGKIDIYYSENQLSVRTGDTYFTTRLIDGTFPNYRQLLPTSFTTEAVVLREDLAAALKTLSIFADKTAQVRITVDSKKKELIFSARNPDVGEHLVTLKATLSGEALEMHFNGRYIADVLSSATGESVRLGFNGTGKPLLISPASDASFRYIVMPMNR